MARIFVIAESRFQTVFDNNRPVTAEPGGTLLQTAVKLHRDGHDVSLLSEVGNDFVGEAVLDYISKAGLDTRYIDRSVSLNTPVAMIFRAPDSRKTQYYGGVTDDADQLDIVWPSDIDSKATVVFGGYIALHPDYSKNLGELLDHASGRKARRIYFPGFDPARMVSMSHVKPALIDNIERSQTVLTRSCDLEFLFGTTDPDEVFRSHLAFYGVNLVNVGDNEIRIIPAEGEPRTIVLPQFIDITHAVAFAIDKACLSL